MGVALILLSVSNLMLFFFGQITSADVSVRRVGGSNEGRNEISYQYAVSWVFRLQGKEYEGRGTLQGSPSGVPVSKRVLYLPFAPWINNLEETAKPSILNIVPLGLGILLVAMARKGTFIKRPAGVASPITPDDVNDYDDSVEDSFHDRL